MAGVSALQRGDFVTLRYQRQSIEAMVMLASENQKSLMLGFNGLIGGHLNAMSVLMDDGGVYRSLMSSRPVIITKIEREPS